MNHLKQFFIAFTMLASIDVAHAGGRFLVDQTRVDLSSTNPAAAITITNQGTEPLRLQLSAVSWREDADGAMELTGTSDVVLRPSLVEIAAGASRAVRIGTSARAATTESTYRVFVEEMPDRQPPPGTRVEVLTRISLPVFVAPKHQTTSARVSAAVDAHTTKVSVRALGTAHLKLSEVRVRGLSGTTEKWRHHMAGWYVLPGAERIFSIDLGANSCSDVDRIVVEVVDESGASWAASPVHCTQ